MSDEMTLREFASMGGKAQQSKLSPEEKSAIGRRNGNITKQKYGLEHYRQLGLKGASKRWAKAKKTT